MNRTLNKSKKQLRRLHDLSSRLDSSEWYSTYYDFERLFPAILLKGISWRDYLSNRSNILEENSNTLKNEMEKKFLTDIQLLFGERVLEDVLKNGPLMRSATELLKHFKVGDEKSFKATLSVGKVEDNALIFGIFTYILAREPHLRSPIEVASLMDEQGLFGIAKAFGQNALARFAANLAFMLTDDGSSFYLSSPYLSQAQLLKTTLDELDNIVSTVFLTLLNEEGLELDFYALRIKSPFDAYGKIIKYSEKVGMSFSYPEDVAEHLFDLNDLIGVRLVLSSPSKGKEREHLLDKAGELLMESLPDTYKINTCQPFASTDNPVRNYHKKPKENGYDRYHLLFKTNGIPVEFQIDTSLRYKELESSPATCHGVQKNKALKHQIENFPLRKRCLVQVTIKLGPHKAVDVQSEECIEVCPERNDLLLDEISRIIKQQTPWELSKNAMQKIQDIDLAAGQEVRLSIYSKNGRSWKVGREVVL